MRKWIVFEAGSRAGLSARLFFDDYCKRIASDDCLILIDDDVTAVQALNATMSKRVSAVTGDNIGTATSEMVVFPADELTRQQSADIKRYKITRRWFNDVEPIYYNKRFVNGLMEQVGISIPKTFDIENVLVKPNTMSAGSRGITALDNVCVQQRLQIAHEYVVDATVDNDGTILGLVARETQLRAGYDKLVRFCEKGHPVIEFAERIIQSCRIKMFRGVCHLQICSTDDDNTHLYYIEGSKRISGTSLVNLLVGYNPYVLLHTRQQVNCIPVDTQWRTYEDMFVQVNKLVYE